MKRAFFMRLDISMNSRQRFECGMTVFVTTDGHESVHCLKQKKFFITGKAFLFERQWAECPIGDISSRPIFV